MSGLVTRLKHVARQLQRSVEAGEREMLDGLEDGETLQRRHCLHAVANHLGFRSWPHAKAVLERNELEDRGRLMYRDSGGGISNIWSASYEEAREIRAGTGGFLLPYDRQFQVVEGDYVRWLGLDPSHPDWQAIGRDWVMPTDLQAWARITGRRIDVMLAEKSLATAGEPATVETGPKS